MSLSRLLKADLQLILFGGKGGVGKTTCSTATGLYMAKHGKKALVFSTDPAHSLSDSFEQPIGDKITQINGIDGLHALEINAEALLEDHKRRYKGIVERALGEVMRGFDLPFEREVIRSITDLSPPGLDELLALSELSDITKEHDYDLIVIDTAAGAHALRLLQMPQLIDEWLSEAFRIMDRYRYVMSLGEARSLMEETKRDIEMVRAALTDSRRTEFVVVTIPEAMGIYVTEDIIRVLQSLGILCKSIVVNYLIPPHVKCGFCTSRREGQRRRVEEIRGKFPRHEIVEVPMFQQEVSGAKSLSDFAKVLFEGYKPKVSLSVHETPIPSIDVSETSRLDLSSEGLALILFGGKGGCGKTTSSAATGIYTAKEGKKTLVLSTDPQRSLSDSFGQSIGDEITPIEGVPNLYAQEIDAEKLLEEFEERHREEILEIATAATYLEREDLARFLDLSLPGMDELMAMRKLMDLMKGGEYDLIVLDTAPTGHTLRFLELPDLMSKWAKIMVKMRSKTRYVVRTFFGRTVREAPDVFLEELMSDTERIKATLTNPGRTEFIAVTTLDEMAIRESERLVATLGSHGIPVKRIIVNGLVQRSADCPYCESKVKAQREALKYAREEFSGLEVVGVPLFPHEIRGIEELATFAEALFGGVN